MLLHSVCRRSAGVFTMGLLALAVFGGPGFPRQEQIPLGPPPQPSQLSFTYTSDEPPLANGASVDELIDRLTQLREEKAALERKEQAVIKDLRARLKSQEERLRKLGLEPAAALCP